MVILGMKIRARLQLLGGIWTCCNGRVAMVVPGIEERAQKQLKEVIWTCSNGRVATVVPGMKTRARLQLLGDNWMCLNGYEPTVAPGTRENTPWVGQDVQMWADAKPQILVVEDSDAIRTLIRHILEEDAAVHHTPWGGTTGAA